MTQTYIIEPFTTKEERILTSNSIPFIHKGNTAQFHSRKDFVRATFQLILHYLPTERDIVKDVL